MGAVPEMLRVTTILKALAGGKLHRMHGADGHEHFCTRRRRAGRVLTAKQVAKSASTAVGKTLSQNLIKVEAKTGQAEWLYISGFAGLAVGATIYASMEFA